MSGLAVFDADWREADLSAVAFRDCTLERVRLDNTILEAASFKDCRLIDCSLSHADLQEARFEATAVVGADRHQGAAIRFSKLASARFAGCDLRFVALERCSLFDIAMEDCDLRGGKIEACDFSQRLGRTTGAVAATFRRCNLHLARLSGLDLRGCDLGGSRLREVDLSATNLEAAKLADCDLVGANLSKSRLSQVDLRRADLGGLDLRTLANHEGMRITAKQQHVLLAALGIDVSAS